MREVQRFPSISGALLQMSESEILFIKGSKQVLAPVRDRYIAIALIGPIEGF